MAETNLSPTWLIRFNLHPLKKSHLPVVALSIDSAAEWE